MKMFRRFLMCFLFNWHTTAASNNLQSLGGTFVTDSLNDGRTGKCATSGFACTFTEPSCPYGGTSDSQWLKTEGVPDQSAWSTSVGTSSASDPPAIAVQLTESNPFAILLSDPITCQDGEGQVMFSFWSTKNTILQVCAVNQNLDKDILCSENYGQKSSFYPGPISFKLPQPIKEPFVIRFMVSAPPEENFVVLDELGYFGSGCSDGTCTAGGVPNVTNHDTTPGTTSTAIVLSKSSLSSTLTSTRATKIPTIPPTTSKISISSHTVRSTFSTTTRPTTASNTNTCRSILCDFESNWCQYTNLPDATTQWQRQNAGFGPPLSRLTDIQPNGGFFLATMMKSNNRDVSIIQSPEFHLTSNKNLKFKFYRGTVGSTIKMCLETTSIKFVTVTGMKECPSVIPPLDKLNARIWNEATVSLRQNVTKFYLVAMHETQSSGAAAIAIDQISITDCV